jgi:hypothetical protein
MRQAVWTNQPTRRPASTAPTTTTRAVNGLLLASWSLLVLSCCWSNNGGPFVAAQKRASKVVPVKRSNIVLTRELVNLCKGQPPIGRSQEKRLKWLVAASGEPSLLLRTSPQHLAACWILYTDSKVSQGRSEALFLQRYALAVLHYATTKSNTTAWDWPMAADDPKVAASKTGNWMNVATNECKWYGVTCHRFFRRGVIYELALGFLKLDGIIPREVSLLTSLVDLDLHGNDFQGVVPHKLVHHLQQLQYLRLHMNGFFGSIQREITGLAKLKELYLFGNYFGGTIPDELSELKDLQVIDMYANQLEGTIPSSLGRLRKLSSLDLHDNNLVGSVPKEICALKLTELVVDCLGPKPEVACDCCTICCRGLPDFKCVHVKTGLEIVYGK